MKLAPVPLLIFSDAPTSSTGLGRITRELATRIHEHLSDTFEVATFGFGGCESRHLPFRQYTIRRVESWVCPELPWVWNDFAGERKGILFSIWNPAWLTWLSDPVNSLPPSALRDFLIEPPFERWIYAPIDAEGPNGKLPENITGVLCGFERVLAYTRWASRLIDRSMIGNRAWKNPSHVGACPHLPHGTDTSVFYPRDRKEARDAFVEAVTGRRAIAPLKEDTVIVGIVATNSARKDWGLGFEVCSEMLKNGVNIGVWAHTDYYQKHWDLVDMANAFGLGSRTLFTNGNLTDETMAMAYSACDVTFGIGSGEGWGMPAMESIACGTPVVHGNYAGGAELIPSDWLVSPIGYRWDGIFCNKRPVFDHKTWAYIAHEATRVRSGESLLPPKYEWGNCWEPWAKWLIDGVNG